MLKDDFQWKTWQNVPSSFNVHLSISVRCPTTTRDEMLLS